MLYYIFIIIIIDAMILIIRIGPSVCIILLRQTRRRRLSFVCKAPCQWARIVVPIIFHIAIDAKTEIEAFCKVLKFYFR